jgi:hypothetical protein
LQEPHLSDCRQLNREAHRAQALFHKPPSWQVLIRGNDSTIRPTSVKASAAATFIQWNSFSFFKDIFFEKHDPAFRGPELILILTKR